MDKDFETEVIERLVKIETKLDDYNSVRSKTDEAHTKSLNNEKRIEAIEGKLSWITRITIGAIITGAIGIIYLLIQHGIGLK